MFCSFDIEYSCFLFFFLKEDLQTEFHSIQNHIETVNAVVKIRIKISIENFSFVSVLKKRVKSRVGNFSFVLKIVQLQSSCKCMSINDVTVHWNEV